MTRWWPLGVLMLLIGLPAPAVAQEASLTLVLPFRMVGVSDTTATVTRDLLAEELGARGWQIVPPQGMPAELVPSASACDQPECAAGLAAAHGAAQAIYGSLSRLGDKIIVRVGAMRSGESTPFYRDQLSAEGEEELDTIVLRIAEGLAAGHSNSSQPTVMSVTREEARKPLRRSSRSGIGFRAGFLFPTGSSFGGADRLTSLKFAYKYEQPGFFVESTTLLGLTFGDGNLDWTILDLSVAKIIGNQDVSPFIGAGVGVHSLHVQYETVRTESYYGSYYEYTDTVEQSKTAPSFDLILGVLGLRTFDFEIVAEARYHHVFEDFEKVNGKGGPRIRAHHRHASVRAAHTSLAVDAG